MAIVRRRAIAGLAVLGLVFVSASQGAESASPVKLRFGGDQSETRLVLEMSRAAQAQPAQSDSPQIQLSFSGLTVGSELDGQGKGLVKGWTLEKSGQGAKLSLELTRGAVIKRRFLLPPADGIEVYRYVVDIAPDGAAPAEATPQAAQPAPPQPLNIAKAAPIPAAIMPQPAAVLQVSQDNKPRTGKKVVVIDAGHGGHDPGALGGRAHEKDITLAAAKTLKAKLERTGKFKIVLTRSSDVFVPLEQRVQIARSAGADLFISLHADVGQDPAMHGATVYTLSDQGVDRAAKNVFDNNGSFLAVKLPGRDQSVKQILLDLTQRNTRNRSGAFAELLIDRVGQQTELVSRSHRDAGYVVLLAPDVPAVLLEMGFITNREDEAELMNPARRGRLMNAVTQAIETYFAPDTRLASR